MENEILAWTALEQFPLYYNRILIAILMKFWLGVPLTNFLYNHIQF